MGSKSSSPQKPLTYWRAKDRCHEQSQNPAHHKSNSHSGVKDRCHEQGQNPAHHRNHSLAGEPRTGIVSRVEIQLTTEATHILESQGQVSSAGSNCSSPWKPLTCWRVKDRHHEQGLNAVYHGSHSQPEEPGTIIVSRVHMQLITEATHFLESQGQVL